MIDKPRLFTACFAPPPFLYKRGGGRSGYPSPNRRTYFIHKDKKSGGRVIEKRGEKERFLNRN